VEKQSEDKLTDVKLIATDMDGTLLDGGFNEVPVKNIEALQKAKDKGILICISTGRPLPYTLIPAEQIEVVDYIIYSNGAGIYNFQDGSEITIPNAEISIEDGKFISNVLENYETFIQLQAENHLYIQKSSLPYFEKKFSKKAQDEQHIIRVVDNVLDIPRQQKTQKFNVEFNDPQNREKVFWELYSRSTLFLSSSWGENLEINSINATKGLALNKLCDELKISSEHVMTFGDNANDIEMTKFAKYGIAMGNSKEELKQYAFYITDTNYNFGLAQAIEKFIL